MSLSRRTLVKLGLVGGVGLILPLGVLQLPLAQIRAAEAVRSPAFPLFHVPLPIPPILAPRAQDATTDHYTLDQRVGIGHLLPDRQTPLWGYNGIFPGPTIIATKGRRAVVHQINHLPVPVSTHLHGGHTPPDSDGYPMDLVMPMSGDVPLDHDYMTITHGVKAYTYPNQL